TRIGVDLPPRTIFEIHEREDVAPGRLEGNRRAALGGEDGYRLFGFLAPQREQDHAPRPLTHEPPRHGLTHQTVAAEDQDRPALYVHRSLRGALRSLA